MTGGAGVATILSGAIAGHEELAEVVAGTSDAAVLGAELVRWCEGHLGAGVAGVPWTVLGSGLVVAIDTDDDRRLVVKVRPAEQRQRLGESRLVQGLVAAEGFPAPVPVGRLHPFGAGMAHGVAVAGAEQRIDGGHAIDGHHEAGLQALAEALQRLIGQASAVAPARAALHEPWGVALPDGQLWPEAVRDPEPDAAGMSAGAEWIDDLAASFRARLITGSAGRPRVVGHVDWRAEHVHVDGAGRVLGVFDWDSLVRAPEPVLVGMAAAGFTMARLDAEPPSVSEGEAFVAAFEAGRGVHFRRDERDLMDAAHGYVVALGARVEHGHEQSGRRQPASDGWRRLLRSRGERALV